MYVESTELCSTYLCLSSRSATSFVDLKPEDSPDGNIPAFILEERFFSLSSLFEGARGRSVWRS